MSDDHDYNHISLKWALSCMAICLIVAVLLDETVARGYGKAILLSIFVTSIIIRTFWPQRNKRHVVVFFWVVSVFHLGLIFVMPEDGRYPGGLLFPVGVLDVALFYGTFLILVKRKKADTFK